MSMSGKYIRIVTLLAAACSMPGWAGATTITLKSGQVVEGKILERDDQKVSVEFEGVTLVYYADEIDKIEEKAERKQPKEQKERKATLPPSVSADHQNVYQEKLKAVNAACSQDSVSDQEMQGLTDPLLQFAQDFPESRFSKDAGFIARYAKAMRAIFFDSKDAAEGSIQEVDRFINLYPDASLNVDVCLASLGNCAGKTMCVPLSEAVVYLKGALSYRYKDYESAISNFSALTHRETLLEKNPVFLQEVYHKLIDVYVADHKIAESRSTAQEAVQRLPESLVIKDWRQM